MTEGEGLSGNYVPLSARSNPDRVSEYEALTEGVPQWLESTLLGWVTEQINAHAEVRLRTIERRLRRSLDWSSGTSSAFRDLYRRILADDDLFLDTVDLLLTDNFFLNEAVGELTNALQEAGSVWTVAHEGGWRCHLERRVSPELESLFTTAASNGNKPAEYLRQAWGRVYGRQPSPDGGYRDAVRAVEAALKPIVSPDNGRTTLGTIFRDIRAKPEKFRMRLTPTSGDPVSVFVNNLELLWTAQLDRHGTDDEETPLNVTLEQAQDAATMAALIVHWVNSGAFSEV